MNRTRRVQIAELEDTAEKVYIFGLALVDTEDAESMSTALDSLFEEAGTLFIDLPVDGDVVVVEATEEDLQAVLDYRDVMEGVDDG